MSPNHPAPILSTVNMTGSSHTPPILPPMDSNPTAVVLNESGMVVEQTPDGEWTYDPNEPRYCICNQVSYGDMVACDNEAVSKFAYPFIRHIVDIASVSMSFLFVLVSIRMVPLSVCWNNAVTERQMVLPKMYSIYETAWNTQITLRVLNIKWHSFQPLFSTN